MQREVFDKVQVCLNEIPEIVFLLRRQMFFRGNKRVGILVKNLTAISDYIVNTQLEMLNIQEWMLILQAVLNAQQNRDYIMLSDVLEGDLLPFLQKVQVCLQGSAEVVIKEYWDENISCIQNKNSELYNQIITDCEKGDENSYAIQFEAALAINGQPTLKARIAEKEFCLHSTVNPEWEAKILAENWMASNHHTFQIFGMGMGYHIKALLDADINNKVFVLEYRIEPLFLSLTYLNWCSYLLEGRLEIIYESDLTVLLKRLKQADEKRVFFLHYPSLQCVEKCEIKEILEDYFITISSMQEQGNSLRANFECLQKLDLPGCEQLKELFNGKTVVIAAGGPSLDDELEQLKLFREDITILSVGTAARKLISKGICPDAIIITDPQDNMYRQIEGLNINTIPMMLLSTASNTIVNHYRGPIYLVYQKGFEPAEKVAKEHGYMLFETGGSVTTTALDVSIGFGAKEIILIGADMAYTDNRSHAGGIGREIEDISNLRQVSAVDGGMVYTSRNLDVYRKWIERRIADLKCPVIYNTSRGARIAGTVEMKLEAIMAVIKQ